MSREIKLRAWDEYANRLWYFCLADLTKSHQQDLSHLKLWEQYTGWKDYKEQDLYDGDIATATWQCTVCYDTEPHVLTGTIEWSDECAMWMFDYGHGSVPLASDELDNILKIGNIHENPELLERTDADKETGR